jgi:lipopolysaccharide/colanic/teichoic acid biosynthesis glycosyltransferase
LTNYQKSIKRTFDLFFSLLGLLTLWPLGILIAICIKLSSTGPVFYKQERIGRFGKPFTCVKFRTMFSGSERLGTITAASDSRITAVGQILRKYKLDELPQIWNVFTGKMSFVGPRPDVSGYADELENENAAILCLQPGITGPASIYFRYEEEILAAVKNAREFNDTVIWPKKVAINFQYLNNWRLWKDFCYIFITIIPALNKLFRLLPESPRTPEQTGF